MIFITSCGTIRKGSLVIENEIKPKVESTFQGLYAREDEAGPKKDRLIVDIHYNDWLGDRDDVRTGWNSIGFNMNGMFDFPFNKKSTVAFATGLRFSRTSVQHDGLFLVGTGQNNTILFPTTDFDFPRSNQRLIQSHFDLPLELRFRGEALKSFRFTLGGSIGVRVNSYEKWREGDLKFREYNHPNTMLLRAGAFVRVGYNHVSLFAGYHFTPIFSGDLDSKLNVFQVGLSLSLF